MNDLFNVEVHKMHHKNAADTEVEAAQKIAPKAPILRIKVLQYLQSKGTVGATGEQVAEGIDEWLYSVKPRITELVRADRVIDSGRRIKNSRNRNEIVWVALANEEVS